MVTFNAPTQISNNLWLLSWSSDQVSPTYYVYQDGILVSTTTSSVLTVRVETGAAPIFDVLDSATALPEPAFPGDFELGWASDTTVAKYIVEQNVAGTFTTIATLAADSTLDWRVFVTPVLSDETTATWRVTPYDAAGNAGTPVIFSSLMVRHPDVPSVTYTYNGSGAGTVTLS